MTDDTIHDPDPSTDARWFAYKDSCRAANRTPLSWGNWLAAGQPVPIPEDDAD